MGKINKITNITLIFMIISAVFLQIAGADNGVCLRNPVGIKSDRIKTSLEITEALNGGREKVIELADKWSLSGKYNQVEQLLASVEYKDADITEYSSRNQKKIEALKQCHELKKKGFDPVIVPDGKGGFFVDTLGFEGKWILQNRSSEKLDNGYLLRLLKSVSVAANEIKETGFSFGKVYIIDEIKDASSGLPQDIAVSLRGRHEVYVYVSPGFVKNDRLRQRKILKDILINKKFSVQKAPPKTTDIKSEDRKKPAGPVQLVSLNMASDIAINLLGQLLEKKKFNVSLNFMENERYDEILSQRAVGRSNRQLESNEDILEAYGREFEEVVGKMAGTGSKIICVSVTTPMIDKANLLISAIKKKIPDAIIIIGGPCTKTPEQLAALMPGADVLIRGEADDIFPKVIGILKGHAGSEDLSEKQVKRIMSLDGGIFVKAGSTFIVNELRKTNVAENFRLAEPRDRKRDKTLFTSRGCPYNCSFCNLIFGRRFRAVPNAEIINWLIKRLALEFPDKQPAAIEELVNKGENLFQYGLNLPLRIEIWDDNFFFDKERIKDLRKRINDLGLDKYFDFSIEGASTRAFYKNGGIDRELADELWEAGFREIKFGTDGLSNAVLSQNNKGYTFDQVVALNKYLREKGFFVRHNLIYTTPQTTRQEFFENMFLQVVFPKAGIGAENPGILGDQATRFNELDVLNFSEAYEWDLRYLNDDATYLDRSEYLVPRQDEYAYRKFTPFNIADRTVETIVESMVRNSGMERKGYFSQVNLSDERVDSMLDEWRNSGNSELDALSQIISKMRRETKKDIIEIGQDLHRQMHEFGIFSYFEYFEKIYKKHQNISGLEVKDVTTVKECLTLAKGYIEKGLQGKAAKELQKAETLEPGNVEIYYAEAALMVIMRNYADAITVISDSMKACGVDIPVYFSDRSSRWTSLIGHKLIVEFMGENSGNYEKRLYEPRGMGLQTEKSSKDFAKNIDIIMHNINEYVNYFT
ncbi:MAG: radical SAM protein, partial [Candidatus Omnitrophota bacterium]